MKVSKFVIACLFFVASCSISYSQCNQTITINSSSVVCNGNGTSTVTINVTILFGNGNNSATISYNIGAGEVVAVILEDDDGDIINQTYMFDVPTCDNFMVTLTAWTNPSGSGSSCSDPAPVTAPMILPVEFGDFSARLVKSKVVINWNTYSEINNDGFEIQRSRNGAEFITVGNVEGAVNSSDLREYLYEDQLKEVGIYYYRIKQNDLDGQSSFSDVRNISFNPEKDFTVYPNPARDFVNFSISNPGKYSIYNHMGQLMREIYLEESISGVDVSDWEKGIYYIFNADKSEYNKFIKN